MGERESLNLREVLELHGTLTISESLAILIETASRLEEEHAGGEPYGLLSLETVVIRDTGEVELAREVPDLIPEGDNAKELYSSLEEKMTPFFELEGEGALQYVHCLAPEYVTKDEVLPHVDLYSFGAVAFRLITGRHPFPATNLKELIHQKVSSEADHPCSHSMECDERLGDLIAKCLERKSEKRQKSISQIKSVLLGLRSQYGVSRDTGEYLAEASLHEPRQRRAIPRAKPEQPSAPQEAVPHTRRVRSKAQAGERAAEVQEKRGVSLRGWLSGLFGAEEREANLQAIEVEELPVQDPEQEESYEEATPRHETPLHSSGRSPLETPTAEPPEEQSASTEKREVITEDLDGQEETPSAYGSSLSESVESIIREAGGDERAEEPEEEISEPKPTAEQPDLQEEPSGTPQETKSDDSFSSPFSEPARPAGGSPIPSSPKRPEPTPKPPGSSPKPRRSIPKPRSKPLHAPGAGLHRRTDASSRTSRSARESALLNLTTGAGRRKQLQRPDALAGPLLHLVQQAQHLLEEGSVAESSSPEFDAFMKEILFTLQPDGELPPEGHEKLQKVRQLMTELWELHLRSREESNLAGESDDSSEGIEAFFQNLKETLTKEKPEGSRSFAETLLTVSDEYPSTNGGSAVLPSSIQSIRESIQEKAVSPARPEAESTLKEHESSSEGEVSKEAVSAPAKAELSDGAKPAGDSELEEGTEPLEEEPLETIVQDEKETAASSESEIDSEQGDSTPEEETEKEEEKKAEGESEDVSNTDLVFFAITHPITFVRKLLAPYLIRVLWLKPKKEHVILFGGFLLMVLIGAGAAAVSVFSLPEPGRLTSELPENIQDTTPPEPPTIVRPKRYSKMDAVDFSLYGIAEPNSTVIVYSGERRLGVTMTDSFSVWNFTPSEPLPSGKHTISAAARDGAGNLSKASEPLLVLLY